MKKIITIVSGLFMFFSGYAQSMEQHSYLIYHNMLMQPDTMQFSFWKKGDTLMVHRILQQYVPTTEESISSLSFNTKQDNKTVEGSRLFNGKRIQYKFGEEKYLLSGDTLYKFVITNRLSPDSIDALFGRNQDKSYSKSDYLYNLKIIAENRTTVKKAIFHPGFFSDQRFVTTNTQQACPDTLRLLRQWKTKSINYYHLQLAYNCGDYRSVISVIIDDHYNFYGFDKKYIDRRLSGYLQATPFKSHFHLKSSFP